MTFKKRKLTAIDEFQQTRRLKRTRIQNVYHKTLPVEKGVSFLDSEIIFLI